LKKTWIRIGTARIAITSGWRRICSPWKANSSTSVPSSAAIDHGPMRPSSASSAGWPPRASTRERISCATITGTTMYSPTEVSSVSHGTVIDEMPSSSATIGAKAKIMIVSFSATCVSVKYGSPPVSRLHTNTIAVQGAAASRIRPAM
jgi:hypothetical protein